MLNYRQLFAFFLFPLSLLATDCIPDCEYNTDWTLEIRGAYFSVQNKAIKKVYSSHWIDYQVEAAKRVHPFIEIFGGVNWTYRQGHTKRYFGFYGEEFRDRTRIYVLPVSLGVKLIYPILPYVDAYVGAGACYSFLKIKNFCREDYSYFMPRSPFKKAIYKSQFGGVFKIGFQVALSKSTFLDFFVDYFAQTFRISHKRDSRDVIKKVADCSGFKFGAGFGVYF